MMYLFESCPLTPHGSTTTILEVQYISKAVNCKQDLGLLLTEKGG